MAVSNAEGRLVLATGNKSELSTGYCTLYGDTVGGLAVLGDVYKHDVYALSRYANRNGVRIPLRTIEKPPSAELAPDQFDADDLPDYDVLDAILAQAIEGQRGAAEISAPPGAKPGAVAEIVSRLDRNEYKRRQSPLVLRTSILPITASDASRMGGSRLLALPGVPLTKAAFVSAGSA
jgi:NAD+ synthase (glutamine-hydrolysing)